MGICSFSNFCTPCYTLFHVIYLHSKEDQLNNLSFWIGSWYQQEKLPFPQSTARQSWPLSCARWTIRSATIYLNKLPASLRWHTINFNLPTQSHNHETHSEYRMCDFLHRDGVQGLQFQTDRCLLAQIYLLVRKSRRLYFNWTLKECFRNWFVI